MRVDARAVVSYKMHAQYKLGNNKIKLYISRRKYTLKPCKLRLSDRLLCINNRIAIQTKRIFTIEFVNPVVFSKFTIF